MRFPLLTRTRFERNLFLGIVLTLAVLAATSFAVLTRMRAGFEDMYSDVQRTQRVDTMQRDLAYFASEHLAELADAVSGAVEAALDGCGAASGRASLDVVATCMAERGHMPSPVTPVGLALYGRAGDGWQRGESLALGPREDEGVRPEERGGRGAGGLSYEVRETDLERFVESGRQPTQREIGSLLSMTLWPSSRTGEERVLVTFAKTDTSLANRWARAEYTADAPLLGDFLQPLFRRYTLVFLIVLAAVGGVSALAVRFLCARLTSPLAELVSAMRRVAEGDLSHRATRRSKDEFGLLVDSFNDMVGSIERLNEETRETERMRKELEMARSIQLRLLPQENPSLPGLDIYGANVSSLEVSGDYYDILPWGEGGSWAIAVGDVSGKGLPASLLMSSIRAWLHGQALRPAGTVAEWVARLSQLVYDSTEAAAFVTFFIGILDPTTRRFEFVNAGHNPPLLLRASSQLIELTDGGPIVGAIPGLAYAAGSVTLAPGDALCLYTDGITEAVEKDGEEMFETERLISVIAEHREESGEKIADAIYEAVRTFSGLEHQDDDMTLVIVRAL